MSYNMNWTRIRILIIISGSFIGALGLILGFILMLKGAMGKFEILGEAKGIKVFVTSVSPGVFLAFMGSIVNIVALRIQKACLGLPNEKQIKARGGSEYYKIVDRPSGLNVNIKS